MRNHPHRFPLELVEGHLVARIGDAHAVVDTGSPATLRAPAIVSSELKRPIRWLVGNDVLRRQRVLLDMQRGRVEIGGPPSRGDAIPLREHRGIFHIPLNFEGEQVFAVLDSGAHLSYAPLLAVAGRRPVHRVRDFHPQFGTFQVDVFELTINVGRRTIRSRFGLLPAPIRQVMEALAGTDWILGTDFFRDRTIELDFERRRIIEGCNPSASREPQVTPPPINRYSPLAADVFTSPEGRPHRRTAPFSPTRDLAAGIIGWRAWRLVEYFGEARLQSVSAPDLWLGPSFTACIADGGHNVGVHAYATPSQLMRREYRSAVVIGRIELRGQVHVHELGYRAEHALIRELFVRACGIHESPRAMEPTGRHYCSCDLLLPEEWLTYEQLEELTAQLASAYRCDATIDVERTRMRSPQCFKLTDRCSSTFSRISK